MLYPEELIEEIRTQNNIIDVVSEYVHITKKGSSHFGLCPFHNEKSPSFSVSEEKQMYYCFGCGAGGNVYTFVMEYENYNFVEAIKALADRAHIQLPEMEYSEAQKKELSFKQRLLDANKEAARYYYYQMMNDPKKKAILYLDKRGIDETNRKKFGLGYANFFRDDTYRYLKSKGFTDQELFEAGLTAKEKTKQESYYDRFFDRLMFPIFDIHNRVIGFGGRVLGDSNPKYLNTGETKLFDKSRNLYGMNIARMARNKKLIIVEGYMDVIALHQAGFTTAVASLGTAFTTGHASLIRRYADEVVIAYDTDDAGVNATLRAIPILKKADISVRVLSVEGAKDPDEYIELFGAKGFSDLIERAEPSFMFEIRQLEKSHNLKDPEGRTNFDYALAKKILTLENEIERENYLDAVVEKYNIKRSAMESLLGKIGKNIGIANQPTDHSDGVTSRDSKDVIMRAQKNMLTLITSHEKVYNAILDLIKPEEFSDNTYRQMAQMVMEAYEKDEPIEPASLIQQFDTIEEQNKIANVFNNNMPIEHAGQFEKMIKENIQIIKRQHIEQLSKQVNDPKQLQEMINMKRQLDSLNISLD
jgi:DNA primase